MMRRFAPTLVLAAAAACVHAQEAPTPAPEAEASLDAVLAKLDAKSRDLATLEVDPDRLAKLVDQLPLERSRVAESGLHTAEDAARVARQGYDMALVGTALMRALDPAVLVREMLTAGREVR